MATGATAFAPKFLDINPIPTKGGRFWPPSQRSQLTFSRGYVPAYIFLVYKIIYEPFLLLFYTNHIQAMLNQIRPKKIRIPSTQIYNWFENKIKQNSRVVWLNEDRIYVIVQRS